MKQDSQILSNNCDEIPEGLPSGAVFILGAGRFGGRAARLLAGRGVDPLYVVDPDPEQLVLLEDLNIKRIRTDAIRFLVEHEERLLPEHILVPALPHHLAFEWLTARPGSNVRLEKIPPPEALREVLPHTWEGSEGSLLVSYADFLCPEDCPEPERCTVTGEKREWPLYELLGRVAVEGFRTHVIRSRQLAPGLGGYKFKDLQGAAKRVMADGSTPWLLCTACKCHGVITAFKTHRLS